MTIHSHALPPPELLLCPACSRRTIACACSRRTIACAALYFSFALLSLRCCSVTYPVYYYIAVIDVDDCLSLIYIICVIIHCISCVVPCHHQGWVISICHGVKLLSFQFSTKISFFFFLTGCQGPAFVAGEDIKKFRGKLHFDSMPTLRYPKLIMSRSSHTIIGSAGKDTTPPASSSRHVTTKIPHPHSFTYGNNFPLGLPYISAGKRRHLSQSYQAVDESRSA